ncbi:MAG: MMPL family transporter [Desulfobacterales bacterium]|nr:MMPL family transporter [Desulfobacterales bacterium]
MINNNLSEEHRIHNKAGSHSGFIVSFTKGLLKARWLILLLALVIGGISIPGIFKLDITVNIEDFFLENDPILKNQEKSRKLFANHDFVAVLLKTDDIFSRDSLELIKKTGDLLKKDVPLGVNVISIVHSSGPFLGGFKLDFENGKLKTSDMVLEEFKKKCNNSKSLNGVLFSMNNKEAWIQLKLKAYPSKENWNGKLKPLFAVGKAAYDAVSSIQSPGAVLIATGVPVYAFRKEAEMVQDLTKILVLGFLVALFLTVLIFKNIQAVAGTLLVICFSVVVVFGIEGWIGISMDSAFIAVPILLSMGVSIGYTVHISRFFRVHYEKTGNRFESVNYALRKSAKPILFTAFTTIAALMSFLLVAIKPIQWVGLTSALCILAVYFHSMIIFPILISFGRRKGKPAHESIKNDFMVKTLEFLAPWIIKHRLLIVLIFVIVTIGMSYGLSKVKVDFNAEKMMGTKLPHMQDQMLIIKSEIAASEIIDLIISFNKDEPLKADKLRKIEILEREIQKLPLVKNTKSISEVIRNINYHLNQDNELFDRIPQDSFLLQMIIESARQRDRIFFSSWVTYDNKTIRVSVQLTDFSSMKIEKNIKRIDELVTKLFPQKKNHFYSGSTYQMAVMNQYITRGLMQSVITALIVITILMVIVFKSVKLGIAAMVPNIFPVIIAGGIMGFLNIPLEFVTMTVAPMIMGLAVDDTIHLVSHLKDEMEKTGNYMKSLTSTFSVVGTAITETTIILCLTFLVFSFSRVNSIINMGIMTCAGILAAYLTDIFLTPIIIRVLKNYKE